MCICHCLENEHLTADLSNLLAVRHENRPRGEKPLCLDQTIELTIILSFLLGPINTHIQIFGFLGLEITKLF